MGIWSRIIPGFQRGGRGWVFAAAVCGFWVFLHLSLISQLVWTEWISSGNRTLLWIAVAACWLTSLWSSLAGAEKEVGTPEAVSDLDPFGGMLTHYLRGDWEVLAAKAARHLQHNPGDIEVRLLYASVLRRQGAFREARRQLDLVRQADPTGKWLLEVHREKSLLRQLEQEQLGQPSQGQATREGVVALAEPGGAAEVSVKAAA